MRGRVPLVEVPHDADRPVGAVGRKNEGDLHTILELLAFEHRSLLTCGVGLKYPGTGLCAAAQHTPQREEGVTLPEARAQWF
ncbi:hypothetical protein Slala05_81660 [Streptomyces lavendulae subsp. lavendulae]|nr:hypothetical protein Slala05_81660 [Streptomyces lavendulae subsp. lavendulae]